MSIEEFVATCRARGWHFTANWVARRLQELEADTRHVDCTEEDIWSGPFKRGER